MDALVCLGTPRICTRGDTPDVPGHLTRSSTRPYGTSTLEKIARACVRHRWIVIGAWVAALVVINGIAGAVGPDYRTDFTLPASETKEVQELLEANSPDRAGFTGQIVFRAPQGVDDPEVQATMNELFDYVEASPTSPSHPRTIPRSRSAPTAPSPSPGSTSPTRGPSTN